MAKGVAHWPGVTVGLNLATGTLNEAFDTLPAFSPDGTKIAFFSERGMTRSGWLDGGIYLMDLTKPTSSMP